MEKIAHKTVLIGAGKGGVGKSTLTLNLAIACAKKGLQVGVLDADLYGPSIPLMMGLRTLSPPTTPDGQVSPFFKFGIHTLSLGFFMEEERSMLWRGPMLHSLLEKLITQVNWPPLDLLLIDLPPGTGDVPLSLPKLLSIDGSVVITTPQQVAFLDVIKATNAFKQLSIPTFGLIENMVGLPFGKTQGAAYAKQLSLPFLGSIPLDTNLCSSADLGVPYAFSAPEDKFFAPLAEKLLLEYVSL